MRTAGGLAAHILWWVAAAERGFWRRAAFGELVGCLFLWGETSEVCVA